MTTLADFNSFWCGICVEKSQPLAVRYFAAGIYWPVHHLAMRACH